jgi:hypothetical protein
MFKDNNLDHYFVNKKEKDQFMMPLLRAGLASSGITDSQA